MRSYKAIHQVERSHLVGRPAVRLYSSEPRASTTKSGEEPLRIALPVLEGDYWTVGPIHLASLVAAVRETYGNGVHTFVFSARDPDWARDYARTVGATGAIHRAYPPRWTLAWAIKWLGRHVSVQDSSIESVLESHGIDVALCMRLTRGYGRIGTILWLADFQHLVMPEMFDEAERVERTSEFLRSSQLATRIVVMSDAVRRDFLGFAPTYGPKVRVLKPASFIPDRVYDLNPAAVAAANHLPDRFIYLPNQFWKHKNHELVLQAVKILKDRNVHVRIVCTGSLLDYRHPRYAAELFRKLSAWGLREHIICLGLLQHEEVLLLMRQCVAVLNPALFEGWGYTVDEARSLGKLVLVSDIPAHREQDPPQATFFNPFDAEDLAARLQTVWRAGKAGPDGAREAAAREQLHERRRAYAQEFVALARETAEAARD